MTRDVARKTQLEDKADYYDMVPGSHLESVFVQMGIPLNYMTGANARRGVAGVVVVVGGRDRMEYHR